jgi:hypothetical protein
MTESRISPEEWFSARRSWESDATVSYAQVADSLGVSKALVAKRARKEKWQRGFAASVSSMPVAVLETPRFTEKPQSAHIQAPVVHGVRGDKEPPATLLNNGAADIPVMPEGLSPAERLVFVRDAIVARQTAMNQNQAKELRAAKATVYAAIKSAGKDGGYDAARTARQVVSALAENHKGEMANEVERVRLDLNQFQCADYKRVIIIVHQRAGCGINRDNSPEAMEHRAVVADAQMTVIEARL